MIMATDPNLWQLLTRLAAAQAVDLAAEDCWHWESDEGDWDVWLNPQGNPVTVRRGADDEPSIYDFPLAAHSATVEYRAMPAGDITPQEAVIGVGIRGYAGGRAQSLVAALQAELAWYAELDEAAAELNARHRHEPTACPLPAAAPTPKPTSGHAATPYQMVAEGDCSRELAGLGEICGHYELSRDRISGDCWRSEDYRLAGGYLLFADDEAASNPAAPIDPEGCYWHLASPEGHWLVAGRERLTETITIYQAHYQAQNPPAAN